MNCEVDIIEEPRVSQEAKQGSHHPPDGHQLIISKAAKQSLTEVFPKRSKHWISHVGAQVFPTARLKCGRSMVTP